MAMSLAESAHDNPFSVADLYRKAGWLGTIPIPYHRKESPPKGYTGNGVPYPSDEDVKNWKARGKQNLALRLAEIDYVPKKSPYSASMYEVMAIDVDDYGDKHGAQQLKELEEKFGKLPPTVRSSSRWWSGDDSCIYMFLVPAGLHFLGKAASAIEIVQKGHRYMMAWPSLNPDVPDAENPLYRWRAGNGAYYDGSPEADANAIPAAVPPLSDIAVLPPSWLDFLTCNRMLATDQEVSDLGIDELLTWAAENFNDSTGDMCHMMAKAVDKKLQEVKDSPSSHPTLISAHWYILNLAAEGHSGWIPALKKFNDAWAKSAMKKSERGVEEVVSEIQRSVIGTISKIEPGIEDNYIVEDTCGSGNVTALHDVEHWQAQMDDPESDAHDVDFGDLGPVIGLMARHSDNSPGDYDQNDHGNARHLVDLYGDDIKYVDSRRSWIMWAGERWHRDIDEKLAARAFSVVEKRQKQYAMMQPRGSKAEISRAESWRRWALRSGNAVQIKNALHVAKSLYHEDNSVALSGKQFDCDPHLLGCENGILVLDDEPVLRPAKKEDYVTYNTHVPYVPWDTEAAYESDLLEGYKLWQEYLDTFLPDIKLRTFIQKVLGHLIVGENPEKMILFVYGPHDTGKSTMLGGISSALGDYYGTIDINLFKNKDLNPQLIRAVPLRVTGMSEIDAGHMDANTIKRLTGNDKVTAEAKFSNEIFEGRPQFTTIIACNHEPDIRNADEALQERILVLPFEYQITSARRQYSRQVDIERYSGPAALSWLVEGWKMYCREGLNRQDWPVEVKRLCGSIVGHLNATQAFIQECIDKTSTETLQARQRAFDRARKKRRTIPTVSDWEPEWTPTTAHVYELYMRWCAANGEKQISLHEMTKELGVGNPQVRNINGKSMRCYIGFRIKTEDDDDDSGVHEE
jgi:P4 family phage/plasmid primase-like protien